MGVKKKRSRAPTGSASSVGGEQKLEVADLAVETSEHEEDEEDEEQAVDAAPATSSPTTARRGRKRKKKVASTCAGPAEPLPDTSDGDAKESGGWHSNILVTGTPGTGKTTFAESLAKASGLRHIDVGKLIKEKKLYEEWDDERDCSIFDEDMLCDELEPLLENGGYVVDFHSPGCFDSDWFGLVVVLRCENSVLYDRLEQRKYSDAKIRENVEAEIFQTCLDDVKEAFEDADSLPIWEVSNERRPELEDGIRRVKEFMRETKA
eukprot:TRINITY_DN18285_c0_g1_i1.p1 TRINITY_DN18285_c0_g1~~TRINITY_DN18285_c0_g1_i1.p1  ORF type:complete len:264 (+),score=73.76 TRINITY_DN18285_c0_g1_i1:67-858(+)